MGTRGRCSRRQRGHSSMSRQSEFDNARAEKIRVERLSRKDFIDADLVHLDDAKRLAIELCLAAEQDANLGVHDQSVHIRAGAQQMRSEEHTSELQSRGHLV